MSSKVALGRRLGLKAGDALIVVDVQRDFLPGGTLAVAHGNEIIPAINSYMAAFAARGLPIFMTRDWHPEHHCSFKESGGIWPRHCVQGTQGAAWPDDLHLPAEAHVISKGNDRNAEAYSAFSATALAMLLRNLKVQRVFVGGLATDYCVHDTVLDARSQGFDVVVLGDAIRPVNMRVEDETRAIDDMLSHGATLFEHAHAVF